MKKVPFSFRCCVIPCHINKCSYNLYSDGLQVGHAGTLDPMATGLLIVCVGKATKVVDG